MVRIRILLSFLALTVSASSLASTAPFPRLATVNYSSPFNYDNATFQSQLAKFNLVLLNIWPGWNSGRSMTMDQVVRNIKSANSQAQVFLYVLPESVNRNIPAMADVVTKIDSMHWWLYPNGNSGTPVPNAWPGNTTINTTLYTQRDSNGNHWVDWYSKWIVNTYFAPNPSIDGFFTDNVYAQPREDGDWNVDGVKDSHTDATIGQIYRNGFAQYFSDLRQQMPGKYQLANVADWGATQSNLSGYVGIVDGGLIEGIIGQSYSVENWGSWSQMMAFYRKTMNAMGGPKLLIFGAQGNPNDYQGFRYGLASCLLDDGYFNFTNSADNYSGVLWFDEYNVKLGSATSSPATTAWQHGVYRRDFQNGIALVNPRGNGTQTVQLETTYRKIAGTQAPSVNNGQQVNSVTLQDRDGIILLRVGSQAAVPTTQPLPPAQVVIQ